MNRDAETLEAALDASRVRLAAARVRAEASGRRPLRRLVAVARVLRHGSPLPPLGTVVHEDPGTARWRTHALDLERELEQLRTRASAAAEAAAEAERSLRQNRRHAGRLAAVVARLDAERDSARTAGASQDAGTTDDYARWLAATAPSDAALRVCRDMGAARKAGPVFSILVPVYEVPFDVLRQTFESVMRQTYPNWELCIVHANPSDTRARRYVRGLAESEPRVRLCEMENGGIARNSNAALELATGEYVVLLDHDDVMVDHALSAFAALLCERPETDFIYSDKDMTDAAGDAHVNPLFKPQWSPETMLTINYVTHLNALRTSAVRAIGGWRPETDGAQDWDLFLRFTEHAPNVGVVRDVLYRWRMIATSVAGGGVAAKPYALAAQVRTLEDAVRRRGVAASYAFEDDGLTLRPTWPVALDRVTVVVLPREDAGAITLAEAIGKRCGGVAEILLPTSESHFLADARIRLLPVEPHTSPVDRVNLALAEASGDFTVIVDGGTLPQEAESWVADLVGPLVLPGVAVVAGKVLSSCGDRIAHTGIVFDTDGTEAELFEGAPPTAYGFIGSAHWIRNVSAVAGGVFAVDTAVAREVGFTARGDHPRADVDFCLRVGRAGHRIVYTPFVTSREMAAPLLAAVPAGAASGRGLVMAMWPEGDPHFHPALVSRNGGQRLKLPADVPAPHDYATEAAGLTGFFDASPALLERVRSVPRANTPWRSVSWILPDFYHAYYGGVATILRFAAHLSRTHGVASTFVTLGVTPPDVLSRRIAAAFPDLAASHFAQVKSLDAMAALPRTDAGICTLWTTAYALLRANVGARYYFVQDNESQFYPAGTASALVEATYRFGFQAICNTVTLADIVRSYGGDAVHFTPAIDPAVFHDRDRPAREGPKRLFAYGRPGHPRNGFELLSRALRTVKAELGDDVDIVTAGAPWSTAALGLDTVMTNLGLLGYRATGDLYRSCDAGAVLMMTSHPSYLPMELMACGAAVVTNANPRTAWLLRDGENAYLAETTPAAVAERILTALTDDVRRATITENARTFVAAERSDWDAEWNRLTDALWSSSGVERR